MADCGAGGSALDRTVRAALGGPSNEAAGKVWAPLLGPVAGGTTTRSVRPTTAPTTLSMPDHTVAPSVSPREWSVHGHPSAATAAPATLHHHQQQHYHHPTHATAASRLQSHHHPAMMNPHHMLQQMHHQQQMMMMMNVQMQQQQQYQRQQQKAQSTKTSTPQTSDAVPKEDAVDYDPNLETYGHEPANMGAGMEELAAAWAEAEAAYEAEFGHRAADLDHDDPLDEAVNLAAAVTPEEPHTTYEFQTTDATPPDNVDPQHWMNEGMRNFAAGNVRQAIYCFETLLLHCQDENNAQAWRMLGKCHAENDQDREAIQCLNQAVERDPYATDALLALAVSHVNELNHEKALACAKAWITHNPQYAGMELTDDLYGEASVTSTPVDGHGSVSTNREKNVFDDVQRLLLLALEHDPSNASAILQTLGVIYNVNRDYDAAVSAFRRALDARPDDYELWNKLGATLANGNQSEKALPAYQRALELRPRYARAWLNMAISYSNLQNYEEAARCYLQTLSLNPAAMHCWSYLRIALSCSEKWDLIPLAASRDLAAFREHYDFVLYENDAPAAGAGI